MRHSFYHVEFDGTFSRVFETKRAAVKWAKYFFSRGYHQTAIVYEQCNVVFKLEKGAL